MAAMNAEIVLDRPNGEYYAGETLNGEVLLTIQKPTIISVIKVRTIGEGLFKWTEDIQRQETSTAVKHQSKKHGRKTQQGIDAQQRKVTEHRTVTNQEKYLDVKTTLFESEIGQSFSTGEYRYPFTTKLPSNLPGSIDVGKYMNTTAVIAYNCKATLKSTARISMLSSKCHVSENFTVIGRTPLPPPQIGIASEEDTCKISCCGICCLCNTRGKVKGTITFYKFDYNFYQGLYLTGTTIIVKMDVENHSRITLNSIRFSILQRIDIYATGESRFHEEDICSFLDCERGHINPGGKMTLDKIELKIPGHLPPSIEGASRVLFVKYFVVVTFSQGSGCLSPKAELRFPITIGPILLCRKIINTLGLWHNILHKPPLSGWPQFSFHFQQYQ